MFMQVFPGLRVPKPAAEDPEKDSLKVAQPAALRTSYLARQVRHVGIMVAARSGVKHDLQQHL